MFKKIGEVILPVLIYEAITFVVAMLWVMGLTMLNMSQIAAEAVNGLDLTEIMTITLNDYMKSILFITFIGAFVTAPVVYYLYKRDRIVCGEKKPEKWSFNAYSFVILLGIGACIFGNNLLQLSGLIDISAEYQEVENILYQGRPLWLQIVGTGLIIPLTEELIFRGLIFKRVRRYSKFGAAAAVSTLVFALFHGNMVQASYAIFLGYLLAYVTECYGNLAAPVVLHCTANLVSILITNMKEIHSLYMKPVVIYGLTAFSLFLVFAGIRLIRNEIIPMREEGTT